MDQHSDGKPESVLPVGVDEDWEAAPTHALVTHILERHHAFLRTTLPQLTQQAQDVASAASAEGARHPELAEIQAVLAQLAGELELHMQKEERILFPRILELAGSARAGAFHCGTVAGPIAVMEMEHEDARRALDRLHELTHDYSPPPDSSDATQRLFNGLQVLQRDLREHIHEESNILFPRAQRLEDGPSV